MPRRLRFALALLCAAVAVAVAGCGSSRAPSRAAARAEALSYLPTQPSVAALVATDPKRGQVAQGLRLLRRFPGSELALGQVEDELVRAGIDYDEVVRPLLGNDVAIGAAGPGQALAAAVAPDAETAGDVLDGLKLRPAGSRQGARLYTTTSGAALARQGSTLLAGTSVAAVRAALDRHAAHTGLTSARFDAALAGLPSDALLRVVGDAHALLATHASDAARRIPWVDALSGFALTVRTAGDGVHASFRLSSTRRKLTQDDVPLATGPRPPETRGDAPVVVGIRDLAHVLTFAQRALHAAEPGQFAAFQAAKTAMRIALGVDLDDDVIAQLTGSASLVTDLRDYHLVSEVKDPGALADALARLKPVMPALLRGAGFDGLDVRSLPGDVYELTRSGRAVFAYGLVAGRFVAGTGTARALAAPAVAPRVAVPGARGALTIRIAAESLRSFIAQRLGLGALGGLALGALGDVTGWVQATTTGLRGELKLPIS